MPHPPYRDKLGQLLRQQSTSGSRGAAPSALSSTALSRELGGVLGEAYLEAGPRLHDHVSASDPCLLASLHIAMKQLYGTSES